MKNLSLALSVALAVTAVVVLHGQAASKTNGDEVTVTGCFQRAATPGPVGTSGRQSPDTAPVPYVLRAPEDASNTGTSGTSGTSGKSQNVTYRLDIADQANAAAHEGQKVQVTGTVVNTASGATAKDESGARSEQARVLKVRSIKTVAGSCSR